jgi:hypothetical protein
MRDPISRILLLLASARIPARDLDKLITLAREQGVAALLESYHEIIGRVESIDYDRPLERPSVVSNIRQFESLHHDIRYLLERSGLPIGVTARQIAKELISMRATTNELAIRFAPKDSFERWLKRAYEEVGASALLRATSIVLDRNSKRPKSDWPLTSS